MHVFLPFLDGSELAFDLRIILNLANFIAVALVCIRIKSPEATKYTTSVD